MISTSSQVHTFQSSPSIMIKRPEPGEPPLFSKNLLKMVRKLANVMERLTIISLSPGNRPPVWETSLRLNDSVAPSANASMPKYET